MQAESTLIEHALRWTGAFAEWSAPSMSTLVRNARLERHRRGFEFAGDRDGEAQIYVVVSGYIAVSCVRIGGMGSMILGLFGPGQVLGGLNGLMPGQVDRLLAYRAHQDSVLVSIPSNHLMRQLDAEPFLWKGVSRVAIRHQREMLGNLFGQVMGSLRQRLAMTIEQLAVQHGMPVDADMSPRLMLTQSDLAKMLQVTRQTVNRGLASLAREGAISPDYSAITILDRDALRRAAAGP